MDPSLRVGYACDVASGFIIFGMQDVTTRGRDGKFNCPRCRAEKRYAHKSICSYFTLFFIPIFPVGKKREYIECFGCGRAQSMSTLRRRQAR